MRKLRELIPAKASARWTGVGGATPLILAAENGHLKAVQFLIEVRSDLNARATGRWTALMLASQKGHLEVVRALLEAGVDPNAESKFGDTALSAALKRGHLEIADLLRKHRARNSTSKELHELACQCAQAFGRSRNNKGEFGPPPSQKQREASAKFATGLLKKVRALVKAGAQGSDYALWLAAGGFDDLVTVLLEANANPNSAPHISSALANAAEKGQIAITKTLLAAGAAVNYGGTGWTPLIEAIRHDHPDIVAELIRAGADINRRENLGPTPLTLATTNGNLEIMRLLIAANADLNLPGTVKIGPKPKPRYGKGWASYPDAPRGARHAPPHHRSTQGPRRSRHVVGGIRCRSGGHRS